MKIFSSFLKCIIGAIVMTACVHVNGQSKGNPMPSVNVLEEAFIYENAPFLECHASTLVDMGDGKIMAAWFGGTHERHPDVSIYTSLKTENGWTRPKMVANGIVNDTLRYPTWNPVLFKNNEETLFLYYKIGSSPSTWWGAYKVSADDGKTWSKEIELPDGILGPIKNKPIQLKNGRIISPSSTESQDGDAWDAHMELSDDDGKTWIKVPVDVASDFKSIQPTLIQPDKNTIKALFRSDQDVILESTSTDNGDTWSALEKTEIRNPNSGIDAVTLKNGMHLLVYNPTPSGENWSSGRQKLNLAISKDGENWQDLYTLEDHDTGEFSYPAIIQDAEGFIHISYTYQRKKIKYLKLELLEGK